MKPATVVLWLKIGSALTIFFGVLVAAAPESRLLAAIGRGVMAGWGYRKANAVA